MNIDLLEERIYRVKNRNFVMNIDSDDILAKSNDTIDDIYSHNANIYLKSIIRASAPNMPYSHHDLHSILQLKYKFLNWI